MLPVHQSPSTAKLLGRSLLPSGESLVLCLVGGMGVVGLHILSLSINGEAYPAAFDDQLLMGYANFIIQPIGSFVNNRALSNGTTVILWGLAGWVLYAILATVATRYALWREARHNIQLVRQGVIVRHPANRTLLVRLLWQFAIGVVAIAMTAALHPVIAYCLRSDEVAIRLPSLAAATPRLLLTALIWALILHCYLVLLRLYTFRTRLFGELLY